MDLCFFSFYTLYIFGSIGFVWVPSGPFYLGQTINPQRADWSLGTSTTWAASSDHQPGLGGDLTPQEGSVHGLVVVYIPHCGSCLCSNRCFVTPKFCKHSSFVKYSKCLHPVTLSFCALRCSVTILTRKNCYIVELACTVLSRFLTFRLYCISCSGARITELNCLFKSDFFTEKLRNIRALPRESFEFMLAHFL
jgi:hypothetical protein